MMIKVLRICERMFKVGPVFLAIMVVGLGGQPVVCAEYKNIPDQARERLARIEAYPRASSILLFEEQKNWMGILGHAQQVHRIRYIGDENAAQQFSTFRLAYVAGRDSVALNTATVHLPDGNTVDVDVLEGIERVRPEVLKDLDGYSQFMELRIALPGIVPGALIELKYRVITKTPLISWTSGSLDLRGTEPIIARTYLAKVMKGDTTNYALFGDAPEPRIDSNFATWNLPEMPPIPLDSLTSDFSVPRIEWSSLDSWRPLVDTLRAWVQAASADSIAIPESLVRDRRRADEGWTSTGLARSWVSKNIRQVMYTDHRDFNFTIRPLSQVISSGYANSFEAAALVCKLAKELGGAAEIVLHFSDEPPVPSFDHLSTNIMFGYALVSWQEDSRDLYTTPWSYETFAAVKFDHAWLLPLTSDVTAPFEYQAP